MSAYTKLSLGIVTEVSHRQDSGHYFKKEILKEVMLEINAASGALFRNYKSCFSFSASGVLFGNKSL